MSSAEAAPDRSFYRETAARRAHASQGYIHGTSTPERSRLATLNELSNGDFVRFLKLSETDHVLEVGSGLGILTSEVAARVPDGMIFGLERSNEQLEYALQQLDLASGNMLPHLQFVQGDAHALPFSDMSFDVVYCRYVLEHVASPLRVLQEMHRVLRPGGKVFLQEGNIYAVQFDPDCARFEEVWRKFGQIQEKLGGDPAIGKRLFRFLAAAGFEDVSISLSPVLHHAGTEGFAPWVSVFSDILRTAEDSLAAHGLPRDEARAAIAELDAVRDRDDATMFFYWNRAHASKPA
ncbi:methyltransferase domain-containing protein [Sorangium sp. So ce118]